MTNRYNPQHGANMVDRYIGSAFDIVYAVYKQLDSMPVFLEFMETTSLEIEAYHTTILEKYDLIVGMEISILDAKDVVLDAEGSALDAKDVALQAATDAMEYRDTTQQLINEAEQFKQYLTDVIENSIDPLFANVERNREDSWANRETLGGLYTHYVREDDGTPVANAECAVYVENSGVLATGLKDKFGVPLANPFMSGSDGLIQFTAEPGEYTMDVSFDLVTHTYLLYFIDKKVREDLADPAEGASMVAYNSGTVAEALDSKVDKVIGKQLSTEDYTTAEQTKLGDLPTATQLMQSLSEKADTASLGTAAAQDVGAFDSAGAAATAQAFAIQRDNHTGEQAISTITGLQGQLDDINILIGDTTASLDAINGEVVP